MTDYSTIVLFADLSGSVQLYETLGDADAKAIVVEIQDHLSKVVIECSGVVHEITGDEIMCRFEDASAAIECAARIHQCTADYCQTSAERLPRILQMRIGIHSGPAIMDGARMFGDTVNTAARIMAIAQAGQTITTQAVLQQLPADTMQKARLFDETMLKGKSEPMVVYDMPWQIHDLTQIKEVVREGTATLLQLGYGDKLFTIGVKDCPYALGRAINCQLVVDSEPVSRRHVYIEFLRGRFVVSDKSTNGTHVYPHRGEAIYLRREQMPLWGKGRFSLGAPEGEALNHTVHYHCKTVSENVAELAKQN